jgi:hypothetical protein
MALGGPLQRREDIGDGPALEHRGCNGERKRTQSWFTRCDGGSGTIWGKLEGSTNTSRTIHSSIH